MLAPKQTELPTQNKIPVSPETEKEVNLAQLDTKICYEGKLSGYFSRIMRTDSENQNLFLRSGVKELTILSDVSRLPNPENDNKHYSQELKIAIEQGNFIVDFTPVAKDRVLILTLSGHLMLYSYQFEESGEPVCSLLSYEQLNFESTGENSFTLALCSKNQYITICTYNANHNCRLVSMFLFEIKIEEILQFVAQRSFINDPISNLDDSYFYAMDCSKYLGDLLIILGVQNDENHDLCTFYFDTANPQSQIKKLQKGVKFHASSCFRFEYDSDQEVWHSFDDQGVMIRLELVTGEGGVENLTEELRNKSDS